MMNLARLGRQSLRLGNRRYIGTEKKIVKNKYIEEWSAIRNDIHEHFVLDWYVFDT